MKTSFLKLMLITHRGNTPLDEYLSFVTACAASGITSVQLREKHLSPIDLLEFGKRLQETLRPFSIPLIINDHPDLALALDAEGVHLGQTDGDVRAARQLLGQDKRIGLTIGSLDQLHAANALPVDYVGLSAIFPTQNKANVPTPWGCEGLKHLAALSTHPIIAVGGITTANAHDVMRAGVEGIAAIGAFHDADDPARTTQALRAIIDGESHAE